MCLPALWELNWKLDGPASRVRKRKGGATNTSRVYASGCKDDELAAQVMAIYIQCYGQKLENGYFGRQFLMAATLSLRHNKEISWAEYAAKIIAGRIKRCKQFHL
jgi:hypothetical protein